MKYKNILLGLGSFATIVSPISTIIACGDNEDITEKSLKTEIDKLQNFTTSHNLVYVGVNYKIDFTQFIDKTKNIVTEYKIISRGNKVNKDLYANLSSGIEISKVVLKKAYDASTHKVVFTVTLAKDTVTLSKDVEVTFAIDLKAERNKLQNFATSTNIKFLGARNAPEDFTNFNNTSQNIVKQYKSITGAEDTSAGLRAVRASGIAVSKVVLKKAYDVSTHKIVFTVTLGKGGGRFINNVKDVIVTFAADLIVERNKLKDHFISQSDVIDVVGNPYDFKAATADDATNIATQYKSITEWNQNGANNNQGLTQALTGGITISKVILKTKYDVNTHKVVFTVTLSKGAVTLNKDVTVTFAKDLTDERKKLKDHFIASVIIENPSSHHRKLIDAKVNGQNIVQQYEFIASEISAGAGADKSLTTVLTSGITISKVVIKTAYDASTHQVVFTVTLAKGKDRVTNNVKDVTVAFAKDLSVERNKLKNSFSSTDTVSGGSNNFANLLDNKKVDVATKYKLITGATVAGQENNKGLISDLTREIEISKVIIAQRYNSNHKKIVFTVTLAQGGDRVTNNVKDVVVTFAT